MLVSYSLLISLALVAGAGRSDTLPPRLAEARDALAAGKVDRAIALAKDYTERHSDDERGFLVLGDAYMKREVTGRYPAWRAYQRAADLAPHDPAAPYGQAMAGWILGPPDGERLAREGFERVLAIAPHYRDAWARWRQLYRDDHGRQQIVRVLLPHAADPVVRGWIAQMELELRDYHGADSVLALGLAEDSTSPVLWAVRAQSAFEQHDSLQGAYYYRRALMHADRDSTDFLWRQVMPTATPAEVAEWNTGVPASQKPGWLESFWARRNPDLFRNVNVRVAEHFVRLRYVQRQFPLSHPLSREVRNVTYRRIHDRLPDTAARRRYIKCEATSAAGVRSAEDDATVDVLSEGDTMYITPPGLDPNEADSIVAVQDYERPADITAEGVAYLRFGRPSRVMIGVTNAADTACTRILSDVVRWVYPWGELRFASRSVYGDLMTNSLVLVPMNSRQFAAMQRLLETDKSSVPERLQFGLWTTQFRDTASSGATDVIVVSTRGSLAATLVGALGGARGVMQSRSGLVVLRDRPGEYQLVANAAVNADLHGERVLGRQEHTIQVRDFSEPSVSDLLLAHAWADTVPSRGAVLAHVPRDLTFAAGDTIRAYAELYGLGIEGGAARYAVTYDVLRSATPTEDAAKAEWAGATELGFTRGVTVPADGIVRETLDIDPRLVGRGRYLLRMRIRDLVGGRSLGYATTSFSVR